MKNTKIKKTMLSLLGIAFLAINGIFLFQKEAQAFNIARRDCSQNWNLIGFDQNKESFTECDNCTRIQAWNPTNDRRCRATPE